MRSYRKMACVLMVLSIGLLILLINRPYVTMSASSGFYDEPFELSISSPSGVIYYTLDGSDPDENSLRYTGPLLITDATAQENTISMRTDVSVAFYHDLIEEADAWNYKYQAPDYLIDKATVIKAIAINGSVRSDIVTRVYFVGYAEKTGYEGMGIVSVVTDPANLFDYETGIYVTGKYFDDILTDGKLVNQMTPNFGWWSANYQQRGKEWERMATITFFDETGTEVVSGNYGIRIQGGSSRGLLPKSLNIYARGEYGTTVLPGELLGVDYEMSSLNLYSGAHSFPTLLADALAYSLTGELNYGTKLYKPYVMFLNGEYWGVYWLSERYKEDYFEEYYGVASDDVIQVKCGEIEMGDDEDISVYEDMVSFITGHDMNEPENYRKASELIDIDSCIDYYATEIYIANVDWPYNNYALWRTKHTGESAYADGKWRWLLYDINISMKVRYSNYDSVAYAIEEDSLFASLMQNDEFKDRLYQKLVELADNYFYPETVDAFIDGYILKMEAPLAKEYDRFYGSENPYQDSFVANCNAFKTFFIQRYAYIINRFTTRNWAYSYGTVVNFAEEGNNAAGYCASGFCGVEETHTWTEGHTAVLRFYVEDTSADLRLSIEAVPYQGSQTVEIYVNDCLLTETVWIEAEETREWIIPNSFLSSDGVLELRFELPDAASPYEAEGEEDLRVLGLAMIALRIDTIE